MTKRVLTAMFAICAFACVTFTEVSASLAGVNCPYDTTGQYTYDAQQTPTYLFFGDGQITYDGYRPWYMDDTLACYEAYRTPGYFIYFPKCDLDGSGAVEIAEVYDIYYRVQPVDQPDVALQKVCVAGLGADPNVFCPKSRYDRVAVDVDAIQTQYPLTEAIYDADSFGLGQNGTGADSLGIHCSSATADLPMASFEGMGDCYAPTATCVDEHPTLPDHCAQIEFTFDAMAVDVPKILNDYEAIALQHGGSCVLTEAPVADPLGTPGIFYTQIDTNLWHWTVRATAQCVGEKCDCDVTYEFTTRADQPGAVVLSDEQDRSTAQCSYPEMGTWPYQFYADSIAARAVLGLRGENGAVVADGDDYLRAVRDLELIGQDHPDLDHRIGWWSDIKSDLRRFNELNCYVDASADRTDLDELVTLLRAEEDFFPMSPTLHIFVFPDDINAAAVAPLFEETNPISSCYQSVALGNGKSAPTFWAEVLEDDGNGRWHWRIETRWGGCSSFDCNCEYAYEFYTYADLDVVEDAQAINPDRSASLLDEAQCGMPCGSCGISPSSTPLLLILMDFADAEILSPANPEARWAEMMFGYSQGQGNHYWDEVSNGSFQLEPAQESFGAVNDGVIRVKISQNQPVSTDPHDVATEWMPEAIDLASGYIQFADYDTNEDGIIQNRELSILTVINVDYASQMGGGAEANIAFNYAVNGSGPIIEKFSKTRWANTYVGVNVHELGHHIFGLKHFAEPDEHGLMGSGSYGEDPEVTWLHNSLRTGTRPTHLIGYHKVYSGLVRPTVLTESTSNVVLNSPHTGDYNVVAVPTINGMLFIENRTSEGYDQSIPFCDGHTGGMFITEVSQTRKPLSIPAIAQWRDSTGFDASIAPETICDYYSLNGHNDSFSIGGYTFTNIADAGPQMTFDLIREDVTPAIEDYKIRYLTRGSDGVTTRRSVSLPHGGTIQIDFAELINGDNASLIFSIHLDAYYNTGEVRSIALDATWETNSNYMQIDMYDNQASAPSLYMRTGTAKLSFDPGSMPESTATIHLSNQQFEGFVEFVNLPQYPL